MANTITALIPNKYIWKPAFTTFQIGIEGITNIAEINHIANGTIFSVSGSFHAFTIVGNEAIQSAIIVNHKAIIGFFATSQNTSAMHAMRPQI